jgi:hypothetical protein
MKTLLTSLCALGVLSTAAFAKDVDIPVTELPAPITASIEKAHPGATLLSAEKDLKADGSIQHFEVTVRVGDQQKELTVLPDGTIQKTEKDN